jgi:hypothetical protein
VCVRVVEAEKFEKFAITWRTAISGNDAVEGAITAAMPRKAYSDNHRFAAVAQAM